MPGDEELLGECEALAAKAAPGPWVARAKDTFANPYGPFGRGGENVVPFLLLDGAGEQVFEMRFGIYDDFALIARSRTALPRLCRRLRAALKVVDYMKSVVKDGGGVHWETLQSHLDAFDEDQT